MHSAGLVGAGDHDHGGIPREDEQADQADRDNARRRSRAPLRMVWYSPRPLTQPLELTSLRDVER